MEQKIDSNEIWVEYHRNYIVNQTGKCRLNKIYYVSNLGRIKINDKIVSKLLKRGYYIAPGTSEYLHRLVAKIFVPNPENKPQVDHIDTNPLNNRADNLRWVTQSENNNNKLTKTHMKKAAKKRKQEGTLKTWKDTINTAGENNPRYGDHYMWVHLDGKRKQVKEEYLDYWLDDGWIYGYGKLKKESK